MCGIPTVHQFRGAKRYLVIWFSTLAIPMWEYLWGKMQLEIR